MVQEAYIKVYRSRPTGEGVEVGYVLQALRWSILDHFGKNDRNREILGEVETFELGTTIDEPGRILVTRAEIVALAKKDLEAAIHQNLQRETQWAVLLLTVLGGYSAKEAGKILGLAAGTVSNYKSVILARLQELHSEE